MRKSPEISELDKIKRLVWCLRYKNCDFSNYIFVDETSIRISDKPLYHWRLPSSFPEALPSTHKFSVKINVWGGISFKGTTEFAVKFLILSFYFNFISDTSYLKIT